MAAPDPPGGPSPHNRLILTEEKEPKTLT